MTQASLLDWTPPVVAPKASEQSKQLGRVSGRIAESVLAFCKLHSGEVFRSAELSDYVVARCGGAPASADRVLRMLRKAGHVDVACIDRASSLYRVVRA